MNVDCEDVAYLWKEVIPWTAREIHRLRRAAGLGRINNMGDVIYFRAQFGTVDTPRSLTSFKAIIPSGHPDL